MMSRLLISALGAVTFRSHLADAECADVSEWADSFGDTCGLYVAQQYCTDIGDWGPGWNPQ